MTDTDELEGRLREQFDAWVAKKNLPNTRQGDGYRSSVTHWCWEAYFSAGAQQAARIAELERELAVLRGEGEKP